MRMNVCAQLIFLMGVTSNIGDYKVNTKSFPSGLGAIRDKIHAAGLQVPPSVD